LLNRDDHKMITDAPRVRKSGPADDLSEMHQLERVRLSRRRGRTV
jgi:hypothetical protein